MKSRARNAARGAALVEYAMLVGLICLLAIGSVLGLGDRIRTTFNEAEKSLYTVQVAEIDPAAPEEEEVVDPLAPTFTWKGDGTDELPPGVTTATKGWIIDISSVAPTGVNVAGMRFDAWVSQRGTFREKHPGDSSWGSSYTVIGRAYWLRDGKAELPMVGGWDQGSPSGELLAYGEVLGGYVPADVIGIRLEQNFDCNLGSICTRDEFNFDIDFY